MAAPARAPWSDAVGFLPHKVIVEELPERDYTLYLRWRAGGNWRKQSLRRKLTDAHGAWLTGGALAKAKAEARAAAEAKYRELTGEAAPARPAAPLTLGETRALITDPDAGAYPVDTPHRREVLRSLAFACDVLGEGRAWAALRRDDLTTLWRRRIQRAAQQTAAAARGEPGAKAETGLRAAEVIVRDVLAIAGWLRDRERIPADAAVAPRRWKQELRKDWAQLRGEFTAPQPQRPRHDHDEARAILAAAPAVDPRLGLLLVLGAELRAGQVERARRSHLALAEPPHGALRIEGKGNKRGEVVLFTPGQRAAVAHALGDGYLRALEEAYEAGTLADYPLFPAGQLRGGRKGDDPRALVERHGAAGPMHRRRLQALFRKAELAAGVTPRPGRGFYGLRRQAVDAVKAAGISREGLQAFGGWSDTQVPDSIYADQEARYGREEAMRVRAQIRGEGAAPRTESEARTQDVHHNETGAHSRVRPHGGSADV